MAPVRRAAPAFQGPSRLDWLLRARRRRAPPPPPPPPSPSPSPPPVPPPSLSPPPSPSTEVMPNASPSPTPPHASPVRTPIPSPSVSPTRATRKRKAEESPIAGSDSDGDGETSSAAMAPRQKMPRTTSTGPEESPTRASSERIPAAPTTVPPAPASSETIPASSGEVTSATVWTKAMTLLEKIRALPPSTFRPFYPRTVERGTRSVKEAKSWTCQQCQHENRPTKHLLFDLPAANCDVCGFPPPEGAADFAFCYADLGMNGFCPIGNVKKQKTNTCVATALSSAVEITHRVMMIVLEEVLTKDGPFMNIEDLLGKYHKRCTGKGDGPNYEYNLQSLLDMLSILVADRVRELEHNNVHKIAGWTFLGADDFAAVCAALADGYPLITGFNCGKRAALLKIGEIYVPPALNSVSADGKRKPVGHCVVLVGAEQAKTEKIVYFLNSAGEEFCERSHKEGDVIHGGVGAIRFKDLLLPPIQILRFNERREQVDISHEAS